MKMVCEIDVLRRVVKQLSEFLWFLGHGSSPFMVVVALNLTHEKGEQDDDWDRYAEQPKQN
jgi:hypothetical protein